METRIQLKWQQGKERSMSEIEQVGRMVSNLSPKDLARFLEFDERLWNQHIEADLKAGEPDTLIAEAGAEFEQGKAKPL